MVWRRWVEAPLMAAVEVDALYEVVAMSAIPL
jgi:hypothetical protein